MADNTKFLQTQAYTIAGSGAIIGATTLTLTSFKDIDGVDIAITDFGTKGYATIEPASGEFEESISFTGVSQNANGTATLTGVKNVSFKYPYTETSGLLKSHAGGVTVIITNTAGFYDTFANKNNDETILGTYSFVAVPNSTAAPVGGNDLTNKTYVDNLVNGGVVSTDRVVVAGTAGETLVAGNLVYFKVADGLWWKTDADTAATVNGVILGIAQGAGTAGVAVSGGVLVWGMDSNQTGLTPGAIYYASNTAGGLSASAGTVEKAVGQSNTATTFYLNPFFADLPTNSEKDAMAGGAEFGTPSSSNKYVTEDKLDDVLLDTATPVVRVYEANALLGNSDTRFDITNPAGTTFRYTWDGTGTDPNINSGTLPIGSVVDAQAQNFNAANKGLFITTGVGANYFEVTNASGVSEADKTIGTGYLGVGDAWTKPAGLKYITLEVQGPGGYGYSAEDGDVLTAASGASGAYARKIIAASALSATEGLIAGVTRTAGITPTTRSVFGVSGTVIATGGTSAQSESTAGTGGTATGGDVNINGQNGQSGTSSTGGWMFGGIGASSILGIGGVPPGPALAGMAAKGYGAGGSGASCDSNLGNPTAGGAGTSGVVILTEFFI